LEFLNNEKTCSSLPNSVIYDNDLVSILCNTNYYYNLCACESGYQVDVIFIDFVKALNSTNPHILSNKLHCIGIRDPFLFWLTSYNITDRKQNIYSDSFSISSGVPQGSHI